MSRLVVVSNRVAPVKEGQPVAGGLAVAVLAALQENGGIWFGWNGDIVGTAPPKAEVFKSGKVTYATMGMTRRDHAEFYNGFSNSTLWPLLHYRLDLTKFEQRHYAGYLRVNSRFARALFPLLRTEDTIWVHDYHLIPLAGELHRLGARQPIGFFLHTPFPALEILLALPRHDELLRALCEYDLIGFQTVNDLSAFHDYIVLEAGGTIEEDGTISVFGRRIRADVFPIGIDTEDVVKLAATHDRSALHTRLVTTLRDRELIIGVDRLDYSKGLIQRFESFDSLLANHAELLGKVIFIQVAPPSRPDVGGYSEIRKALETAAGHINGKFADFDWVPIRYLNKSFERGELCCFYRNAKVALVTPLRDGMNLVAKEYVAAQRPRDPGVLVLSRFAGAARELDGALIVNPHDIEDVTSAMQKGLDMPAGERRERWRTMMNHLKRNDIHAWRKSFLKALAQAGRELG